MQFCFFRQHGFLDDQVFVEPSVDVNRVNADDGLFHILSRSLASDRPRLVQDYGEFMQTDSKIIHRFSCVLQETLTFAFSINIVTQVCFY